jgi:hypothetical protein
VGELLVPVQTLKVSTRSPVYVTSHSLVDGVYTSRAAELNVLMEKLPAALRGVGTSQLRYVVCRGAFFMF